MGFSRFATRPTAARAGCRSTSWHLGRIYTAELAEGALALAEVSPTLTKKSVISL
jgi:hypothetical protein